MSVYLLFSDCRIGGLLDDDSLSHDEPAPPPPPAPSPPVPVSASDPAAAAGPGAGRGVLGMLGNLLGSGGGRKAPRPSAPDPGSRGSGAATKPPPRLPDTELADSRRPDDRLSAGGGAAAAGEGGGRAGRMPAAGRDQGGARAAVKEGGGGGGGGVRAAAEAEAELKGEGAASDEVWSHSDGEQAASVTGRPAAAVREEREKAGGRAGGGEGATVGREKTAAKELDGRGREAVVEVWGSGEGDADSVDGRESGEGDDDGVLSSDEGGPRAAAGRPGAGDIAEGGGLAGLGGPATAGPVPDEPGVGWAAGEEASSRPEEGDEWGRGYRLGVVTRAELLRGLGLRPVRSAAGPGSLFYAVAAQLGYAGGNVSAARDRKKEEEAVAAVCAELASRTGREGEGGEGGGESEVLWGRRQLEAAAAAYGSSIRWLRLSPAGLDDETLHPSPPGPGASAGVSAGGALRDEGGGGGGGWGEGGEDSDTGGQAGAAGRSEWDEAGKGPGSGGPAGSGPGQADAAAAGRRGTWVICSQGWHFWAAVKSDGGDGEWDDGDAEMGRDATGACGLDDPEAVAAALAEAASRRLHGFGPARSSEWPPWLATASS